MVYADVDPVLHPMAERSVRAHLDKLVAEGAVTAERREGQEVFRG
jgi:predicted ArsR family transcriptional regulator